MISLAFLLASSASALSYTGRTSLDEPQSKVSACPLTDSRDALAQYLATRLQDHNFELELELALDGLPQPLGGEARQRLRDAEGMYRISLAAAGAGTIDAALYMGPTLDLLSPDDRKKFADFVAGDAAAHATLGFDSTKAAAWLKAGPASPDVEKLFAAAGQGCLIDVKAMIESGAKADPGPTFAGRPLLAAAKNCSFWVAEYLFERGAALDATDGLGRTPAQIAFDGGCPNLTWAMVEAGAPIDAADKAGETLLSRAVRSRSYEDINDALAFGADAKMKVKGRLPADLLPKDDAARGLFAAKPFRALERETDFDLLPEAERQRLAEGKLLWRRQYYGFQVLIPTWFWMKPWEKASALTSLWTKDLISKEAGARPHVPPVLVKTEYESNKRFQARVEKARADYESRASAYDARIKAFPSWKRNAVLEKAMNIVLLRSYVSDVRYDADGETFFVTVASTEDVFKQQFRLAEKVPNENAQELASALKTSDPVVTFQVDGDSITPAAADFIAFSGGRSKDWRAVPDATGGASQEPAVVDLAGSAPAGLAASHPAFVTPAAASPTSEVDEAPGFALKPRPHDFAVVVGIESYQDDTLPRASYAESDADAVAINLAALGVPKDNIFLMKGAKATAAKLKLYLDSYLAKNVRPDSRVYFYFSGHGAPDPETGRAYLVPWDSSPNSLKETGLSVAAVYESLGKLEAKQVLVATDTCFSGKGARSVAQAGVRPLRTLIDDAAPRGVTALAAAGGDQIARSLDDQGHGAFTYFFLKGLRDGAKDTDALCAYLADNVKAAAARQNGVQTPVCKGPDFAFQ